MDSDSLQLLINEIAALYEHLAEVLATLVQIQQATKKGTTAGGPLRRVGA